MKDYVEKYLSYGWVPINVKGKKATRPGWQHSTSDDARQVTNWTGIGILLGEPSGGLMDIDLDCEEARCLAPAYLPPTATFGRDSNKRSHWLYAVNGDTSSVQFKWPESASNEGGKPHILEFRGSNAQTVFPPSIHTSSEPIKWCEGDIPTRIDRAALEHSVKQLVIATVLARFWNKSGSRDELATALCGSLIRSGWSAGDVKDLLAPILVYCGDEERASRLEKADRAEAIINEQSDVRRQPGWPVLAGLIGEDVCRFIRGLVGAGEGVCAVTDSLNKVMALVLVGSKVVVMLDGNEDETFISTHAARELYANQKILVDKKLRNPIDIWLESRDRRDYPNGLIFDVTGTTPMGYYNLFRGWAMVPRPGDCSKFLGHIKEVIACGDEHIYQWVLAWLADIFQNTCRKPGTMLMLRGVEGCGKGTLVNEIGRLLGRHYMPVAGSQDLARNFNAHLASSILVFADEALWGGDRSGEGRLKQIITEPHIVLEKKGHDPFKLPSYHRIIGSTNHDWAVPAGATSRRFTILDVSGHRAGDKAYFDSIHKEMAAGGREALLHHLLHFDIHASGADPTKCLITDALRETRAYTADPMHLWWKNILESGELPGTGEWETVSCSCLYQSFMDATRHSKRSSTTKESSVAFGMALKKVIPGELKRERKSISVCGMSSREWHYRLPPLNECVIQFEKVTGLTIDLEGDMS